MGVNGFPVWRVRCDYPSAVEVGNLLKHLKILLSFEAPVVGVAHEVVLFQKRRQIVKVNSFSVDIFTCV